MVSAVRYGINDWLKTVTCKLIWNISAKLIPYTPIGFLHMPHVDSLSKILPGFSRSFAPASSRLCSHRRFCGFRALSSEPLFRRFRYGFICYAVFFALSFSLVSNFTLPHNKPKQQYIYGIKG